MPKKTKHVLARELLERIEVGDEPSVAAVRLLEDRALLVTRYREALAAIRDDPERSITVRHRGGYVEGFVDGLERCAIVARAALADVAPPIPHLSTLGRDAPDYHHLPSTMIRRWRLGLRGTESEEVVANDAIEKDLRAELQAAYNRGRADAFEKLVAEELAEAKDDTHS